MVTELQQEQRQIIIQENGEKNVKSLGQWFKHEESVSGLRGAVTPRGDGGVSTSSPMAPYGPGTPWSCACCPWALPAVLCSPQRPPSPVNTQGTCSCLQEARKAVLLSLILISNAYQGSWQTWFN